MPRLELAGAERVQKALDAVSSDDRDDLTDLAWRSVHAHPRTASCHCLAIEVIGGLLELGYTITKPGDQPSQTVES